MNQIFRIFAMLLVGMSSVWITGCSAGTADQHAKTSASNLNWPPVMRQRYPDIELCTVSGKPVKLSDYAGKVILMEPIGMNCPGCQAFVGGNKRGGCYGVTPQAGIPAMNDMLMQVGVSPADKNLVRVHLLLYGPTMGVPTLADAQSWAKHFGFGTGPNEVILVGDARYQNQHSYDMIPGFQLIDKNFTLVCDASGHNPKNDLYNELVPMVKTALAQ